MQMRTVTTLLMMIALVGGAAAAPFTNGSLEGGPSTFQFGIPAGSTAIPGWVVSVGNVDWEGPPPLGWQPSDGINSLDLVGTGGIGGVQQTFDTVPSTTYVVTFDLAGNYAAPPVVKPLAVTVDGVTHNYTFDTTGKSGTSMGWVTQSFTYVATGTSSTINFVSDVTASGGSLNAGAALDNVRIAPLGAGPVNAPIPLTWAQVAAAVLLALSGMLSLGRRRG
jgi:choice-of-anchor C domain-containing protein